MKKYLEIAKTLFKAQMVYRFDVVMTVICTLAKILFAVVLWGAVFDGHETVAGFTYGEMLSYYIIAAFLSQIEMSEGVSGEISGRIRDGTFSKYMVLPVGVRGWFIAQTFGAAGFYLLFILAGSAVCALLAGSWFVLAADAAATVAALCMVLIGLLFMIELNLLLGFLAFRFLDIWIFLMIKNNLVSFVTGGLIPLALLPRGLVSVMRFFPFYYVTYLPSMLLIGKNRDEALMGIALLAGWFTVLALLNKLVYQRMRIVYDGVGI